MARKQRKDISFHLRGKKHSTGIANGRGVPTTTTSLENQNVIATPSIATVKRNDSPNIKDTSSGSPFLGLSAELRNIIYSYTIPGPEERYSHNAADFKFPAITRVSKQLRQEPLPIFFAQCNFVLCVGSNLTSRASAAEDSRPRNHDMHFRSAEVIVQMREEAKLSGTLGFKAVVERFIADAGNLALFKDVSMRMYLPCVVRKARYAPVFDDPESAAVRNIIATQHLRVVGSRLQCDSEIGEGYLPTSFYGPLWQLDHVAEDVEGALKDVENIAVAIADRDGFSGFTIRELRQVAAGFRYREPGKREPCFD